MSREIDFVRYRMLRSVRSFVHDTGNCCAIASSTVAAGTLRTRPFTLLSDAHLLRHAVTGVTTLTYGAAPAVLTSQLMPHPAKRRTCVSRFLQRRNFSVFAIGRRAALRRNKSFILCSVGPSVLSTASRAHKSPELRLEKK